MKSVVQEEKKVNGWKVTCRVDSTFGLIHFAKPSAVHKCAPILVATMQPELITKEKF